MSRLYDRACRLTVYRGNAKDPSANLTSEGVVIEGLRVRFVVERNARSEPNRAEIEVTNASQDMRRFLAVRPSVVLLEAGYADDLRRLFQGDLTYGSSRLEGSEWITTLQVGDGDRVYRHARINRSYSPGTRIGTIIGDAAKSVGMSLPADFAASAAARTEVASGVALAAPWRDVLTGYLAGFGYSWSVQDGKLVILPDGVAAPGAVLDIDESSGLVGSPESEAPDKPGGKPRITLTTLLYPPAAPKSHIRVTSAAVSGTFLVDRVTHRGDTHGQDWTTEFEAEP